MFVLYFMYEDLFKIHCLFIHLGDELLSLIIDQYFFESSLV